MFSTKITLNNKINIFQSIFSGQLFLWDIYYNNNKLYLSVIGDTIIIIQQISENSINVLSTSTIVNNLVLTDFINQYFSIDIDSRSVFTKSFYKLFPDISQHLQSYLSLRILRQNPFETMISFMCAQGIGMHLIRKQVSMLKKYFGEEISITIEGREIILHTFPTPERLAGADPHRLSLCTNNNRIRAANIVLASRRVAEGKIDFDMLRSRGLPLAELRNTLCQNSGIGFKIADCIALFGLGRFDAFPIDTHVRQYMGIWFNSTTALRSLTPATYLMLDAEARTIVNPELAGYAGHILFHCWRSEIKKLRSF